MCVRETWCICLCLSFFHPFNPRSTFSILHTMSLVPSNTRSLSASSPCRLLIPAFLDFYIYFGRERKPKQCWHIHIVFASPASDTLGKIHSNYLRCVNFPNLLPEVGFGAGYMDNQRSLRKLSNHYYRLQIIGFKQARRMPTIIFEVPPMVVAVLTLKQNVQSPLGWNLQYYLLLTPLTNSWQWMQICWHLTCVTACTMLIIVRVDGVEDESNHVDREKKLLG